MTTDTLSVDALRELAQKQAAKVARKIVRTEDIILACVAFINDDDAMTKQNVEATLWANSDGLSAKCAKIRNVIDGSESLKKNMLVGYSQTLGIYFVRTKSEDETSDTTNVGDDNGVEVFENDENEVVA